MLGFFLRWSMNLLALVIAASLIDGIKIQSVEMGMLAAAILSIVNAVIRPIVLLLTLPLSILTLGLFTFIVNALMLLLVSRLVPGLVIDGFGAAFWGGLIISMVSFVLNVLIGGDGRMVVIRSERRDSRNR